MFFATATPKQKHFLRSLPPLVLLLALSTTGCNVINSTLPASQSPAVKVALTPGSISIHAGNTAQLSARVDGASNTGVVWSLSPQTPESGSISSAGIYTAPAGLSRQIRISVIATSIADSRRFASAGITVNPGFGFGSVTPQGATIPAGGTLQYTTTVGGFGNNSVTWSITSTAPQPGSISSSGLYSAPSSVASPMQVTVTATSVADPTQFASTTLTVNPVTVRVSVSPASASVQAGATQQFTAAVTGATNNAVVWTLNSSASQPGTISSAGLYTAPSSLTVPAQVTVTATSVADATQSASAFITVNPAPSVHVSVAPQTATLQAGGTLLLTPTVTGTNNRAVTWSLLSTASQAGSISALGLYAAPSGINSNIQVTATATSVADPTQSASAVLTITPVASVQVAISPQSASLAAGGTQQFTATVTGTSNTTVAWSVSPQVGTLSTDGLYTAPANNTTNVQVSITATSAADSTQSATATVTVQPASTVSVSITPTTANVTSGATQQFTAAVTGSSNTAVTWSASVGTVSAGLYTAPVTSVQEDAVITATSVADPTQKASATVTVSAQTGSGAGVPPSFFGMHVNSLNSPWPTVPFASYRTLNSDYIKWADINTADQTYNWNHFDKWMARAQANGQDIMYTLFTTPTWASSRGSHTPNPDYSCVYWNTSGPGACDPPNDLNADGTGTDKHWKDFITAITNHVGPGKIKYWEIWNEYNNQVEWTGTQAQMLRMAKDAYTIIKAADSNAMVTTPSVSSAMYSVENWVKPYLLAGGGDYADIIAIHGYVHLPSNVCPASCPDPQIVATILDNARATMQFTGQQNKPLFDTEGSWGEGTQMNDSDMQVAFVSRFLLIQAAGTATSKPFDKFYWYGWDFRDSGHLFKYRTGLTPAGTAYEQVNSWLVGASQGGCSALGNRWTCPMTRTGYQAEAIWDSSQTCSSGTCSTVNVNVPATYVQYRDLAGNVTTISNNTVPVGLKPILLESGNAP